MIDTRYIASTTLTPWHEAGEPVEVRSGALWVQGETGKVYVGKADSVQAWIDHGLIKPAQPRPDQTD